MEQKEFSAETAFADGGEDEPIMPEDYAEGDDIFGADGEEERGAAEGGEKTPAGTKPAEAPEQEKPAAAPEEEPAGGEDAGQAPKQRDLRAEALAFYRANPDYQGRQLPERVLSEWIAGKPLLEAWRGEQAEQRSQETEKLKKELQTLRQTVQNQQRAPVRGVGGFGAAAGEPDDPFLEGLRADW